MSEYPGMLVLEVASTSIETTASLDEGSLVRLPDKRFQVRFGQGITELFMEFRKSLSSRTKSGIVHLLNTLSLLV
uniref:SFRICE_021652 n=1 Tax=Spodoptera frugiperda TaxID=7108 RepID=A0A2H1WLG6_SPOFR